MGWKSGTKVEMMFPPHVTVPQNAYNLFGYRPGSQPEEKPSPSLRQIKAANLVEAKFLSSDGKSVFRERYGKIEQADWSNESLDYDSWWEVAQLPEGVIEVTQ